MQNENRRVGSGGVDFLQRRHPAFGKLELAPAAHHADPLAGRRALRLVLEHTQAVGEGRHAVPTELHIIVQPAANDVQVRVVETGNATAAFQVDDLRVWSTFVFLCVVNADNAAIFDGDIAGFWILGVQGRYAAVIEDEVGRRFHTL